METLIVNLSGQPGAGKSTGSAYIFSKLKMAGINCEYVSEFCKDKQWEDTKAVFENQLYIFGKQSFKISRASGKVDVIITDAPLYVSSIYNPYEGQLKTKFDALVLEVFNTYNNLNFFVKRVKEYNPVGRFQTEDESDQIAKTIKTFLNENWIRFREIEGNEEGYNSVVEQVISKIKT